MTKDELRQQLEFYRDLGITTLFQGPAPSRSRLVNDTLTPATAPSPSRLVNDTLTPATAPSRSRLVNDTLTPATAVTEPRASASVPSADSLLKIREDMGECTRCRLHEGRNRIVFGSGNESAKLVFVGEGPGADEDAQGIPFVGRAGQLLTQMIDGTAKKEGIPIQRSDVYICNVVKCRPPENRTPLPDEMEICGQFLARQLEVLQPKAICALGGTAAKALLGTKEGVTKLRGKWHKWRDIPMMVTFHPSYLLRPYSQDAKRETWEDLKRVLHYVYD